MRIAWTGKRVPGDRADGEGEKAGALSPAETAPEAGMTSRAERKIRVGTYRAGIQFIDHPPVPEEIRIFNPASPVKQEREKRGLPGGVSLSP